MPKAGKVYLVGAGCGKADLITVRGLRLLRECDVVVYDDLIDKALVAEVPEHAQVIHMGKRQGRHSASQDEICAELIRLASEGKTVVRLKGGDPFVFGRGGEEMLALKQASVPCDVVPGISSAVAIPAMAGIPVTMRGLSRSVSVITAHTADTPDGLPESLNDLAKLEGTLVFLMGLSRLEQISSHLRDAGMPVDTPAAVLSGGNASHSYSIRGTLGSICEQARTANAQAPAVIVIGDVAALDLTSAPSRSLDAALIGVSGSEGMTSRLCNALEEKGAQTFVAQRSILRRLPLPQPLAAILDGGPKWLVFTSANGVRMFFRRLEQEKVDHRQLAGCKMGVIGEATRDALWQEGFHADLCPAQHTTEALGSALLEATTPNDEIVLLRSKQGSKRLYTTLVEQRNARDVHLYEAVDDVAAAPDRDGLLKEADYLVFTSAGGVQMFSEHHGSMPEAARCVCIGEVTRDALPRAFRDKALVAEDASVEEILRAIECDWNSGNLRN